MNVETTEIDQLTGSEIDNTYRRLPLFFHCSSVGCIKKQLGYDCSCSKRRAINANKLTLRKRSQNKAEEENLEIY